MTKIPFDEWGGVDQLEHRRMAKDAATKPMVYRLMFAALGWSNLIGHAEFRPDELAVILHTEDPRTGEVRPIGRTHLANEISDAVRRGLLGDGSSARCLVAPPWFHKGGGTGGKSCGHHGLRPRRRRAGARPVTPGVTK